MPEINRRQLSMVRDALSERKMTVALNKSWQWIHDSYGIGRIIGKTLTFTTADHADLRKTIEAVAGEGSLSPHLDFSTRTNAAEHVINEKLSSQSIGRQGVFVSRVGLPLQTVRGACTLQPGIAAWMNYRDVQLCENDVFVVIENLEAFLGWSEFCVPAALKSALVLYRGHDEKTRGASEWLAHVKGKHAIIAFTDFDPAGMRIAMSTPGVTGWLAPENPREIPSNHALFAGQGRYFQGLAADTPLGWRDALQIMMDDHIALTQERMSAQGVRLTVIPREGQAPGRLQALACPQ